MVLRLIEKLREHARQRPGAVALRTAGNREAQPISWLALLRSVERVAACLAGQQLPAGAPVLLCYPNRPECAAAFLGVLESRHTLVCLPADSAGPELTQLARSSCAAGAIVSPQTAPLLSALFSSSIEVPEAAGGMRLLLGPRWESAAAHSGPALLLQSSGTTGQPRIVRRDGPSLDAVSANMAEACGFTADDCVLAAVPLSHSYGLEHGILAPIWAGSCVHVLDGFDLPIALSELRQGITLLPGVPFMFEMLCRAEGAVLPKLRRAYSAGGPLPRQTYDTFHSRFGMRLGQLYGATEVGSVTFNDPDSPAFDPASVGRPMRNVSIRILDLNPPHRPLPLGGEGQVAVAAPSMLSGYITGEPAPLVDGHFLTGDIGSLDVYGALTITGRLKLLIDVGGRKVNPAEVESVLVQHPDVGKCVVVPIHVSASVSRVKAVVTPSRPEVEISVHDLRRFARERLSAYKVPRVFEVRASLPTSPIGKVLRHLVEAP